MVDKQNVSFLLSEPPDVCYRISSTQTILESMAQLGGDPDSCPAEETTGSERRGAVPDTTQSLAELRIESSLKSESAHHLAGRCSKACLGSRGGQLPALLAVRPPACRGGCVNTSDGQPNWVWNLLLSCGLQGPLVSSSETTASSLRFPASASCDHLGLE